MYVQLRTQTSGLNLLYRRTLYKRIRCKLWWNHWTPYKINKNLCKSRRRVFLLWKITTRLHQITRLNWIMVWRKFVSDWIQISKIELFVNILCWLVFFNIILKYYIAQHRRPLILVWRECLDYFTVDAL